MFTPPPLPTWDALHPLVVHFPVALLFVVPLLVLLAAIWRTHAKPLVLATWVVLTLGTAGALLATATGDAAEHSVVSGAPGYFPVMQSHERVAETARNAFLVLWGLYTLFAVVVLAFGKPIPRAFLLIASGLYLALHIPAMLVLANAAHLGGRLVHEFGARAPYGPRPAYTPPAEDEDDGGDRDSGSRGDTGR